MARRRILIAIGTIAVVSILLPPWQNAFYNDSFIGWRPLLRPPTERVRILDYEVREGRMPASALGDPETVARYERGFVAAQAVIAWNVLTTEWLVLVIFGIGLWFSTSRRS